MWLEFSAVTVTCKCRKVTVKGPRGTLIKSFKHIDMELTRVGKKRIRVDIWFATRKQMACLRTICSHIENMFKGVLYVSGYWQAERAHLVVQLVQDFICICILAWGGCPHAVHQRNWPCLFHLPTRLSIQLVLRSHILLVACLHISLPSVPCLLFLRFTHSCLSCY